MRRLATATILAFTLVSPAALVPSAAADELRPLVREGETAMCTITTDYGVSISPGLTLLPVEATIATIEPAVFECRGSVAGREVTGPGTISYEATATGPMGGATCEIATGKGRALITIPTADGPVELVNNFTFEGVMGSGKFNGDTYSGVFSFIPGTV